jgi:hypothetical protein
MGIGLGATLLLMSALFSSESAFINQAARADVKKYILDKDRQAEVLDLMKTYEKEFNVERKKEKKQEKALEKLFAIRTSEMSDFQLVFDDYMQSRELRQLLYIEGALKVKSIMTDTEWANILTGFDSRTKIQSYEQDKLVSKVEYSNKSMEAELKKWIEEEQRANQASLIMKEVNASEVTILKKFQALIYKDSELFRNKTASEEEYKIAFKEYNSLWRAYFDMYTKAYKDLSAVTTDKEWQIMKKYTKGMF